MLGLSNVVRLWTPAVIITWLNHYGILVVSTGKQGTPLIDIGTEDHSLLLLVYCFIRFGMKSVILAAIRKMLAWQCRDRMRKPLRIRLK